GHGRGDHWSNWSGRRCLFRSVDRSQQLRHQAILEALVEDLRTTKWQRSPHRERGAHVRHPAPELWKFAWGLILPAGQQLSKSRNRPIDLALQGHYVRACEVGDLRVGQLLE